MKIKFNYYINCLGKHDACAAYFKSGKWRIYNYGAHYSVKNKKEADSLLQEVRAEMHIRYDRVKLVRAKCVEFKEVKIK